MAIKNWPKMERPRERLVALGPESLSDAELLAILLSTGSARKGLSAVDCGRLLLETHGSLRNLSGLSVEELSMTAGVGPVKASRIRVALEIGRRVAAHKRNKGVIYQNSRDVFESYVGHLRDEKQETFTVVLLDAKNRYLRDERVSLGALNQSIVHPREVYNRAVRDSAAAVVFVHNHPSGDPLPSEEDVTLTHRLVEAGRLLGIRVLDHIVIGDGTYYSFFDEKLLENGERKAS